MSNTADRHLSWSSSQVTAAQRAMVMAALWFGSRAPRTVARPHACPACRGGALCRGHHCYVLDGDNIRHRLNRDLGFSARDRDENIGRVAEVARLFVDAGLICISAFIAPYRSARADARAVIGPDRFFEVQVRCPLEICEARHPKGLYRKARSGALPGFTGIDAPTSHPRART
jgi:adenylylsulfate kinase